MVFQYIDQDNSAAILLLLYLIKCLYSSRRRHCSNE